MATTKSNIRLDQIENNEPLVVRFGNRSVRVRMMTNAVAKRFERYISQCEINYSADAKTRIVNMSENRELVPKCVSLLILHNWIRVKLFHWIYWRILDGNYNQKQMGAVLDAGFSLGEYNEFVKNSLCLQDNNQMSEEMSKATIRNIVQGQNLARGTTPSSPSTDQ